MTKNYLSIKTETISNKEYYINNNIYINNTALSNKYIANKFLN